MSDSDAFTPSCPIPLAEYPNVLLAHGGGGRLTSQLIEKVFLPAFGSEPLDLRHDGAVVQAGNRKLAFTTDSYVVRPLFFKGGDIGTLAVYGTVNDLAMCGAQPRWISLAMIIEEGFPMEDLRRVARSVSAAAKAAAVQVVTGDTKVVDRGKGDGLFLNTAGVGVIRHDLPIAPAGVKPGDAVVLSGDIGRHGMAIMAAREGLSFESEIESDCAPVAEAALKLLASGVKVHCLRDLTRGGLGGAVTDIAATASVQIDLEEKAIPVNENVRAACEILGLDPLYVANEGRFLAFVPEGDADWAAEVLRSEPVSAQARVIGRVKRGDKGVVTLATGVGSPRIVDMPSGEQLPRIC